MRGDSSQLPAWIRLTNRAKVVGTCHRATGVLGFEGASPHLAGSNREQFLQALRRDIASLKLERAQPVFRKIPRDTDEIQPETCSPYIDANGFGFYLKNVLPLVFVKTKRGEILPEARVAIKYLRENAREFSGVLDLLKSYAHRIFKPQLQAALEEKNSSLFSDVAQPYSSFSNKYMVMPAGYYVMTPPGIATILGPPINQRPVLAVHSGLMESEWHHSELFVVFDCPDFVERVLVIEPDTVLAQFYFVAKAANDETEIAFSESDPGADPAYSKRSIEEGLDLLAREKPFVVSKLTGVKSVSVACPHCWVSITAAAEGGVPEGHTSEQDFYQGYKILRAEYRKAMRQLGVPDRSANDLSPP